MALTPNIQSPEGLGLVATRAVSVVMRVPEAFGVAAINFPSNSMRVSEVDSLVATSVTGPIQVDEAFALVATRGRVANPKLRAWTFVLDGHDFYVLRLGNSKTLLFDLSTGTWSWWTTENQAYWRINLGMNWKSPVQNAVNYGSNVVVGDDTFGVLWILNPNSGLDDGVLVDDASVTFPRAATGQMITRGRETIPVYEVYLTSSLGDASFAGAAVTLEYSDDEGKTFKSAGAKIARQGDYRQEFAWRSLGRVEAPGRLFRINDNGAFSRIDTLDVVDGR